MVRQGLSRRPSRPSSVVSPSRVAGDGRALRRAAVTSCCLRRRRGVKYHAHGLADGKAGVAGGALRASAKNFKAWTRSISIPRLMYSSGYLSPTARWLQTCEIKCVMKQHRSSHRRRSRRRPTRQPSSDSRVGLTRKQGTLALPVGAGRQRSGVTSCAPAAFVVTSAIMRVSFPSSFCLYPGSPAVKADAVARKQLPAYTEYNRTPPIAK